MRRESSVFVLGLVGCTVLAGCSQLERLSIVRPYATIRDRTQIAPTYDVSGKRGQQSEDPYVLLSSATDLYERHEYDQAERLLDKVLRIPGSAGDASTLLGLIAEARGKPADAGKYYEAATVAGPQNPSYANNYGKWLCANGRAADSLAWFERALGNPAYATPVVALTNAGDCAQQATQPDRAETYWRAALGMDPNQLQALAGMAKLEFARAHYMDARAFAERWLALTPGDAVGLRLAADIEQKLGDNAAASRYLSRLQATPPGTPTAPSTQ